MASIACMCFVQVCCMYLASLLLWHHRRPIHKDLPLGSSRLPLIGTMTMTTWYSSTTHKPFLLSWLFSHFHSLLATVFTPPLQPLLLSLPHCFRPDSSYHPSKTVTETYRVGTPDVEHIVRPDLRQECFEPVMAFDFKRSVVQGHGIIRL